MKRKNASNNLKKLTSKMNQLLYLIVFGILLSSGYCKVLKINFKGQKVYSVLANRLSNNDANMTDSLSTLKKDTTRLSNFANFFYIGKYKE